MARRFVGIPVSEQVRGHLDEIVEPVRTHHEDLRWTRVDGWHVTLAFCGELADDRLAELGEVVRAVACASAPIEVRIAGVKPLAQRVLSIVLDDEPPGASRALGEMLQVGIERQGLPVVRRAVRPHITMARRRARTTRHAWEAACRATSEAIGSVLEDDASAPPAVAELRWRADELVVWRSRPTAGASHYVPEVSAPLGGGESPG